MKETKLSVAVILLGASLVVGIFGMTLWLANGQSLPGLKLREDAQGRTAFVW